MKHLHPPPRGRITAKFSDGVFKRGAWDACYQKWSLSLQKKKKKSDGGVNYQTLSNKRTKMRVLMTQTARLHSGNMEENHSQSTRGIVRSGLLGGPAGPAHLNTSAAPRAATIHAFNKASIVQVHSVEIHPNKYINT